MDELAEAIRRRIQQMMPDARPGWMDTMVAEVVRCIPESSDVVLYVADFVERRAGAEERQYEWLGERGRHYSPGKPQEVLPPELDPLWDVVVEVLDSIVDELPEPVAEYLVNTSQEIAYYGAAEAVRSGVADDIVADVVEEFRRMRSFTPVEQSRRGKRGV